jgi:hypothetical protein
MSFIRLTLFMLISALQYVFGVELHDLQILGIEPMSGPVTGNTRVTVRLKDFDKNLIEDYDRPKVRF